MHQVIIEPERLLRDDALLRRLYYGWGNGTWTVQNEYLRACCRRIMDKEAVNILECGSGLSTILFAVFSQRYGVTITTLEHLPHWSEKVQSTLKRLGLDSVSVYTAPLRSYGDFHWYDPPFEHIPDTFDTVICDGPLGKTLGGRVGLLPVMKNHLDPQCMILLDDGAREDERHIAGRWSQQLGTDYELHGKIKPYIIIHAARHSSSAVDS